MAPNATEVYEGFPFLVDLLMQTEEQLETAEGTQCTGVIISDHWVATSESCCENVKGAILDFTDDRTGSGGNSATGSSTVSVPCAGPQCAAGRKRRGANLFDFTKSRNKRSTDDDDLFDYERDCVEDDAHTGDNCHRCGFCIKSGICLMRAHANILRRAEIHGVAAKKICLPKREAEHGRQCWISGFDSVATRTPIEMNIFNEEKNKWCIDHSSYTTIPDDQICAGYPHEDEAEGHDGDHEHTLAANTGFDPAQGGPIICKEAIDESKPDGDSILVFVGVSYSNMLSQQAGKPGLFTRVYDNKEWINEKLSTFSDWSKCDHTCQTTRVKGCGLTDADEPNCKGGLVTEYDTCKAANYTSGKLPGDGFIDSGS